MRTEVEHNENHVILELQDVTYCYDGETLPVWEHLSCCFYKGKIHAISGPSGCGKSSILYLLDGLVPHMYEGELTGRVLLEGEDLFLELSHANTSARAEELAKKLGVSANKMASGIRENS